MTPAESQARLDGQSARLRGVEFVGNPHPMGCANSRAWSKGWREVDEKFPRKVRA